MNEALTELLRPYSPEVRALALAARALVLEVMPGAVEQVDPRDKLIGYGHGTKMSQTLCTIMLYRAHVHLGIANPAQRTAGLGGAPLPDPAGLLEGTGKRHRHVKLKTPADVAAPALRALLEAAAARHKT
jgi:Domain of unknown function (DU1801)